MVTVKQYADAHGKSVQAVYQQINSKENKKDLEGHITVKRVGNRNTKYLDDEAVRILEQASAQAPTIIVQNDDKERIAELMKQNEALKAKIVELEDAMNHHLMVQNDQIIKLTEQVLLLTQKDSDDKKRHWWQRK